MNKFELADKLYKVGYEHKDVKSIWAYAWDEQHIGQSGKKRKPWQLKALEEVSVKIEDIEFDSNDTSHLFRVL
ncbi:hypothetical protein [Sulfurovum sp. NBC37-1]|uniref:hypothetical protein n=1 Tax=Sulfurovum sp. (strain NBC37-1) TaxID=387093 RepID=UPI0005A2FA05|nr:hypothetical protein [Sulfurovum sp. NBC37-1]